MRRQLDEARFWADVGRGRPRSRTDFDVFRVLARFSESYKILPNKPLSQWAQEGAYDSASECEGSRNVLVTVEEKHYSIGVADMDRVTIPLLRTPPQSTARISIDTDSLHLPQDFEDRTADGRVGRSDRIPLREVAVVLEDRVGGAATGIAERLV